MAFWMQVQFRTALPQGEVGNVLSLRTYQLKFLINNAKELHDTRHETWAARVQETLHQWENMPEKWPIHVVNLEIIEREEEND